jgi:dihydrofolate reductase
MTKTYCAQTISLDGFSAGLHQTAEKPFGDDPADQLHRWMFEDTDANQAEIDAVVEAKAYIMGRNMFGPGRGEWDLDWKGWWGPNPPYHGPVFVLTHHERESLEMEGGTTYHFVTDGIESALRQAKEAAGDGDVAIAGGAATVRQYLRAGLIDELRVQISPILLGAGEAPFIGAEGVQLEQVSSRGTRLVTHVTYRIVR